MSTDQNLDELPCHESSCGFRAYYEQKKLTSQRESLEIQCTPLVHLTTAEQADVERLRARALENYEKTTGYTLEKQPFYEEFFCVPDGVRREDKLIFRAFDKGTLIAYAQVICGWPAHNEWAVDQLIIDPASARQGIGSKLINQIENIARTAEITATSIVSLPTRPESDSFWRAIGYSDEGIDENGSEHTHASACGISYVCVLRKAIKA